MDDQVAVRQPVFNVPAGVAALLGALVCIHALRQIAGPELDRQVLIYLAFFPVRLGEFGAELPGGRVIGVTSMATHALLHADWVHLLVNGAWLLAFGSMIARRTGTVRLLLLFIVCAVAGALAYVAYNGFTSVVVVGASGAVSGLMGASFRVIFTGIELGGRQLIQEHPELIPRPGLVAALTNRRVLVAVCVWTAVNLIFGLFFAEVFNAGGIAWEAHVGGFFAGFLLFGLFDQGLRQT
ncbi:MAG: rhomboid family intramembrane serine protease [Hyphomicrobiaceae bacterium]